MNANNKRNIYYFEAATMKGLFAAIDKWQSEQLTRLQSLNVEKDNDVFCCIAVSNPTEVVIVDGGGSGNVANVRDMGGTHRLCTD